MHSRQLSTYDFERLLIELVERLAAEYEPEVSIGGIVKAVRRSRELLGNEGVDAPDGGIDRIERLARELLHVRRPPVPPRVRSVGGAVEAGLVGS